MTPEEVDSLGRRTVAERARLMEILIPYERDVLILANRDKVIDLRPEFRKRRNLRLMGVKS